MTGIRKLRLLAEYQGTPLRLCKILFTANDASIYIIPYASHAKFCCGRRTMPEHEMQDTFDYSGNTPADQEPKLSIHESGQVHVFSKGKRVGPLEIGPLQNLRGQHIATVCFDRFEGLMPFEGSISERGSEVDHLIPVEEGVQNGRLAIYVNGAEPQFAGVSCRLTVTVRRATIPRPMYVGVKPIAQASLNEAGKPGVTVIAGWNPMLPDFAEQDYLYIRGE